MLPALPWPSGLPCCLSSLLFIRLASSPSMGFKASLLPAFYTVFPTCFQPFHGFQGLPTACLLRCLSDLLPALLWPSGPLSCLSCLLSFRLASSPSRACVLPVSFTVFPTCFQPFHGLQGLPTACLLYCLSDLLPALLWASRPPALGVDNFADLDNLADIDNLTT